MLVRPELKGDLSSGSRVYRPAVLAVMNNWEFKANWWHDTKEDKLETEAFVSEWNKRFGTNQQ